jgi:hypothetical protein
MCVFLRPRPPRGCLAASNVTLPLTASTPQRAGKWNLNERVRTSRAAARPATM